MWWVSTRIRAEREHCCDDLAIAACGDPARYAQALLALAELRVRGVPIKASGDTVGPLAEAPDDATTNDPAKPALAATGPRLLPRIRRVLGMGENSSPSRPIRTCVLAGVATIASLIVVAIVIYGCQAHWDRPASPPAIAPASVQDVLTATGFQRPASWPKDSPVEPKFLMFYPQELEDPESTVASATAWMPDGRRIQSLPARQLCASGWPPAGDDAPRTDMLVLWLEGRPSWYVESCTLLRPGTKEPLLNGPNVDIWRATSSFGLAARSPSQVLEFAGWALKRLKDPVLPPRMDVVFDLVPQLDNPEVIKIDPNTVKLPFQLPFGAKVVDISEDQHGHFVMEIEADIDSDAWSTRWIEISAERKDLSSADTYGRDPIKPARHTKVHGRDTSGRCGPR